MWGGGQGGAYVGHSLTHAHTHTHPITTHPLPSPLTSLPSFLSSLSLSPSPLLPSPPQELNELCDRKKWAKPDYTCDELGNACGGGGGGYVCKLTLPLPPPPPLLPGAPQCRADDKGGKGEGGPLPPSDLPLPPPPPAAASGAATGAALLLPPPPPLPPGGLEALRRDGMAGLCVCGRCTFFCLLMMLLCTCV